MMPNMNMALLNQEELLKQLDIFYAYKEKDIFANYLLHRTKRLSFHSTYLIGILLIVFVFPVQVLYLLSDGTSGVHSSNFLLRICLSLLMFLTCVGGIYSIFMLIWEKSFYQQKEILIHDSQSMQEISYEQRRHPQTYSTIFSFCSQAYFICLFLRRTLQLDCDIDLSYVNIFDGGVCYTAEELTMAVSYNACFILILPLIIFIGISNISVHYIWVNYCSSLLAIIIVASIHSIVAQIIVQNLFLLFFCAAAITDLQFSGILDYALFKEIVSLHTTLQQLKESSEMSFREEMRILLGNVAHDIKSVSHF